MALVGLPKTKLFFSQKEQNVMFSKLQNKKNICFHRPFSVGVDYI